uniref:Uncharacterized protein n=1 Tax=Hyaloperonospora arabidopsidis (strain Emoy2) TaxID=559515 RepID=M4BFA5_HYAAE
MAAPGNRRLVRPQSSQDADPSNVSQEQRVKRHKYRYRKCERMKNRQKSVDHSTADDSSGSMRGRRCIVIRWQEAQGGARITHAYKQPGHAQMSPLRGPRRRDETRLARVRYDPNGPNDLDTQYRVHACGSGVAGKTSRSRRTAVTTPGGSGK